MIINMKEMQRYGTEMLREVVRICDRNNITYYLFYGNLLGAIRHKGLIPWDSDVDIAVPEDEYKRFSEAMERELDPKYWWDFRNDHTPWRCFGRIGLAGFDTYFLHLDAYRLIGLSGDAEKDRRMCKFGRYLLRARLVKTVDPSVYQGRKRKKVKILKVLLSPIPVKCIVRVYDRLCARYPYSTAKIVGTAQSKNRLEKKWLGKGAEAEYEGMKMNIPEDYDSILTEWYGDYMTPPPGIDIAAFEKQEVEILKLD